MAIAIGPERNVVIDSKVAIDGMHHKRPHYIGWDGESILALPDQTRVYLDTEKTKLTNKELKTIVAANPDRKIIRDKITQLKMEKFKSQLAGTTFGNLVTTVSKDHEKSYFVIMVRPSGFNNLLEIRDFFIKSGIDVGYEPVGQNWSLALRQ